MIAFSTTLYNESIVGLGFSRNFFVDVVTDFVIIRVLLYSHPLVYHYIIAFFIIWLVYQDWPSSKMELGSKDLGSSLLDNK